MEQIMIRCPETGKPLSTGIVTNQKSFAESQLANNTAGPCPHCGNNHTWNKEDAWLGDETEEEA